MVNTSPSNAEGVALTPGGGAKISHDSQLKKQNIKAICNKFKKSELKIVHTKKRKKSFKKFKLILKGAKELNRHFTKRYAK